ncbi:endoribonuclease Dicer3a-like [Dorcoceras hygrometricum]|uniref:Endoribonuclease Dicer3a-like n=1 Tax=Dorcoceras hygrometricum TaxID=472368 RepID=A0A2Z7D757_9LAMI|nr:endoribonuclease Dicer3a-like [Dorcoceras hygrometricum]
MHCSSAGASFLVKNQQLHFFVENQQLHCHRKIISCVAFVKFSSCVVFIESADALYISRCIPIELIQQLHSFVRIQQLRCLSEFSRCTVHQQMHSIVIVQQLLYSFPCTVHFSWY